MLGEGLGSKALQRAAGPPEGRDEVGGRSADGKHHTISSTLVMRKIQGARRRCLEEEFSESATILLEGRGISVYPEDAA